MRIFRTLTPTVWKFTALSIMVAGAFGVLHDQISYTVSPEFFTRFKFIQFGLLDPDVPERLRAATVGFLADLVDGHSHRLDHRNCRHASSH